MWQTWAVVAIWPVRVELQIIVMRCWRQTDKTGAEVFEQVWLNQDTSDEANRSPGIGIFLRGRQVPWV